MSKNFLTCDRISLDKYGISASATVGIIVGVILAIILILVIIVIIYFRCRKTATDYHMSEKEIAQGRNPVKEFENNIGFKVTLPIFSNFILFCEISFRTMMAIIKIKLMESQLP